MQAFTGGDIYTPDRIIRSGVLLVAEGKIAAVGGPELAVPKGAARTDCAGRILAPGFVDLHIHGGGGGDFMDATPEALAQILAHHAAHGTTSLLATTTTAPMEKIWRAFAAIRAALKAPPPGAEILGNHMEGPFFAVPEPGCHIAALIHDPTEAEVAELLENLDVLKRITLAPERPGALAAIRQLAQAGVLVSGGHTDGYYSDVRRAAEAGMRHITHLWSSMTMTRRIEAKRFAGVVEATLVSDDLTTEVISDGWHLPSSLVRLAYKCKGPEKLCLISDAMRASGMPPGVYEVCGLDALVETGVAVTLDRKGFASSIITLDQAVQHTARTVGLALLETLRMASATPARIIGVSDRKGLLAPGRDADLVLLDPATLAVAGVWTKGKKFGKAG